MLFIYAYFTNTLKRNLQIQCMLKFKGKVEGNEENRVFITNSSITAKSFQTSPLCDLDDLQ